MPDNVDPATRSRTMARVHSKDTTPELAVRRAVHAAGHRYQLHRADLPGKPDLVFPRHRLAVFVHGCFWHWHGCKRSRMPADNNAYWTAKIERNRRRDEAHRAALEALGWRWRIIWECEVKDATDRLLRELSQERDVLATGPGRRHRRDVRGADPTSGGARAG